MAVLEIDYRKLIENINQFNVERNEIIAVVKNDAYNMELADCVKVMYEEGIRYFATTSLKEAIVIRELYYDVDIFLINPTYEFNVIKKYNIEINIASVDYFKNNIENLKDTVLHLEYAGFINRAGARNLEEIIEIIALAKKNNIRLKGFWCHFAHADEFDGNYEIEREMIISIYENIQNLYDFEVRHFQNSASYLRDGIFKIATHIRPGIMLYGAYPYNPTKNPVKENCTLTQMFGVTATVLNIRSLSKGETIGYCNSYVAQDKVKLATVNIGYGDGILRARLTGKECIINKKRYKIVSTMMSHIVIEIDELVNIGDEVIIYNDELSVDKYGKYCNTNSEQMSVLNKTSLDVIKNY